MKNNQREMTKSKSKSATAICDSIDPAQMTHGRRSVKDASKNEDGTGLAIGSNKRKSATAKHYDVAPCFTEPRKTLRPTPSVTRAMKDKDELTNKKRDWNSLMVDYEMVEDEAYQPELKGDARIVGSKDEISVEGNLDGQCTYKETEPKALMDSKPTDASLRKNSTQKGAVLTNDPRYCLTGNSNHKRFKPEKCSNSTTEVTEEATHSKPHRHRKAWTSVLESRGNDVSVPTQVKTPDRLPSSKAQHVKVNLGETPVDGSAAAPSSNDPRRCEASMDSHHIGHDALENDFGLPTELIELVSIVESQAIKGKGTKWDWHHIHNQASQQLRQFIAVKRIKSGLSRRSVVGEALLPSFESFHARIRKKRLSRDGAQFSLQDKTETNLPSSAGKLLKVQVDEAADIEIVALPVVTTDIPSPPSRKRVPAPACQVLGKKQLASELRELASILAKARGHSWAYIESKASPRLKSFIVRKARADPAYLSAPLRCLVPTERFDEFEKLVEQCTVSGRSDHICSDAEPGSDENYKQGNKKDRKLGQVFALERRSRIKALTANLRAELRAFEAQEIPMWESFLRG